MQKICSKCGGLTNYDGDLHCRKILKDKIEILVSLNELGKAKALFDSEQFDEEWKKRLLNELKMKSEAGRALNKLFESEKQQNEIGNTEAINYSGGRQYRVTHCYNCREPLNNSMRPECNKCSWIICKCGACRCQYAFL